MLDLTITTHPSNMDQDIVVTREPPKIMRGTRGLVAMHMPVLVETQPGCTALLVDVTNRPGDIIGPIEHNKPLFLFQFSVGTLVSGGIPSLWFAQT